MVTVNPCIQIIHGNYSRKLFTEIIHGNYSRKLSTEIIHGNYDHPRRFYSHKYSISLMY